MSITTRERFQVTCDNCGRRHPFFFDEMPDEDDLNNANGDLDFEADDGCWELHIHTALRAPNCYCGRHGSKRGVWCPDCSAKFWKVEDAAINAELLEANARAI